MVAGRADLADLPDWPRLLSAEQAAVYLGVRTPLFKTLSIPRIEIGSRVVYDRLKLDAWVDARSNAAPANDDYLARFDRK